MLELLQNYPISCGLRAPERFLSLVVSDPGEVRKDVPHYSAFLIQSKTTS